MVDNIHQWTYNLYIYFNFYNIILYTKIDVIYYWNTKIDVIYLGEAIPNIYLLTGLLTILFRALHLSSATHGVYYLYYNEIIIIIIIVLEPAAEDKGWVGPLCTDQFLMAKTDPS